MLARDKGNFHARGEDRTRHRPVQNVRSLQYSEGRELDSRPVGQENFRCPGRAWCFPSFQVENVQCKCVCDAHYCIIKINKNKINREKKTKWRMKGK